MNYFFDVGSNIGQTFYWYLDQTKEYDGWSVFCFEPSPRNLGELLKTIYFYRGRYNIVICPFGLAGETGVSEFYLKTDPAGDSYNKDWVINDESNLQVLSPTIDVSTFLATYTTETDNVVIKLDCEGSEYGILDNLYNNRHLLPRVSKIMVEWHGQEEKKEELIKKFKDICKPLDRWDF